MKTLYKLTIVLLLAVLLISCRTANTVVVADNNIYYDYDAIIANDIYNELYNNGLIEYKPIIIEIQNKK